MPDSMTFAYFEALKASERKRRVLERQLDEALRGDCMPVGTIPTVDKASGLRVRRGWGRRIAGFWRRGERWVAVRKGYVLGRGPAPTVPPPPARHTREVKP